MRLLPTSGSPVMRFRVRVRIPQSNFGRVGCGMVKLIRSPRQARGFLPEHCTKTAAYIDRSTEESRAQSRFGKELWKLNILLSFFLRSSLIIYNVHATMRASRFRALQKNTLLDDRSI